MRKTGILYLILLFTTQLATGQDLKVGLLFDQFASVRWEVDASQLTSEFKKNGIEVIVKVAHSSLEKQVSQAQELADEGVKVFVVIAVDGRKSSAILDIAKSNDILVVAYDRLILDPRVDLYVSYNNLEVGRMQAQAMIDNVKKGNILMMNGPVADNNAVQFRKGHLEVLDPLVKSGQITIVDDLVLDTWSDVSALMKLYEVGPDFSKIDGMLSAIDWFNDAAMEYTGDSAMFTKIYMTGQDPSTATAIKLKKDIQNMTVCKPIAPLAIKTVELTMAKLNNQKTKGLQKTSVGSDSIDSYLLTPIYVDKNNVDEYQDEFLK
ncbi:substrate-binding domain-containing protein [Reichenbachiella carrageenanivorans]|uniref:Substrate-binding domain-containing protein n=1 Tax=Reichenbachiella carrageenanivorans TaxID=2979869 RepID=A0ABY6D201_9BACT|nr:substrate-binding domain-containing protein [Reichenbachiella carrageenanivorans]UXX79093.1 substrate-binding domain-containing protein [Reichenbachiella carrageenanivorans]